jgi:hypothetical protein
VYARDSMFARRLIGWPALVLAAALVSLAWSPRAVAQAPAPAPAAPPPAAPAPAPYAAPPAAPPPTQYQAPPPQQYAYPPAYAPPMYAPAYPPAPKSRPPRASKGLMISGIAVLGGSYLVAMLAGSIILDEPSSTCVDCQDVGPLLFIPVIGPYIAMGPAVDGEGVLALLGTVEVVGLGLMIGGIIRYVSTKRAAEQQGYYGLQVPLRAGRSLALDVSASPARVGPSLKLRF